MRQHRIFAAALLLSLASVGRVHADSIFGFAYFGGDVRSYDARIEAKGGAGIAQRDSLSAASKVATQLLDLELVTVSVVANFQSSTSEDAFGTVSRHFLQVPSLRVGLPLGARGAFGIGFQAMRATQWSSETELALPGNEIALEFREREGTQFAVPMEFAYEPIDKLRLSAGFIYEGGTVRMRYEIQAPTAIVDPVETQEATQEGLAYSFGAALHELGPLSVAGYFVPEHDSEVTINIRGVAADARQELIRDDTKPARWGVGGELRLPSGWRAAVDFEGEDWSQYEGRSFLDENGQLTSLLDERRWSFGLEHRQAGRRRSSWDRPWRFGGYLREWNYALGGEPVEEWGLSMGTSIDFRVPASRADIAFGYARIGDLDKNGVSEGIFRLQISVTGGEKWY
jgi:hypothetical protein